jgi:UDP-GlcNAc:undecaprenyl-phosphate GlcNAc-1-phosphate transferase
MNQYAPTLCAAGLCLASFVTAWIATGAMKRLAPRIGFVDKPGVRKIHHVPKPLGGGVAIVLGFSLPLIALLLIVSFTSPPTPAAGGWLGKLATHYKLPAYWSGGRQRLPMALDILIATVLMHLLGLWDDRKALGPYFKLIVQLAIIAGLVLLANLRALTVLDYLGLGRWPSVVVTVLWIGAITNAFNFLDNMDGLSAGVAAVCTVAFMVTTLSVGQWFVAGTLALVLGAVLGFLCYNFPPATIFMGDSGSLVIGLLLGVLTVRTTYLEPGQQIGAGWYAIFAPAIVLALPLYDLLVVSTIRIMRGSSPFRGDTNHFSHRLVARGMSRRTAVICLYLVTAATASAAIILANVQSSFIAILVFVQTLLILGVVALLEQHPLPMIAARPTVEMTKETVAPGNG